MNTIDRLHERVTRRPTLRVFTAVVRVLLALAFVPSGLVKIMGEPFTTLPVSDPVGFFFVGFFSAHAYYRFIGAAQWTASGLLLVPRTAALGAFVYLPIIANIFAITVAIGPSFAGTRVITGAMLLANIYLLCWDWDRWKIIVPAAASAHERRGDFVTTLGILAAAGIGFAGVTRAHLARLHHAGYAAPLTRIAIGALLGLTMLAVAYRRAARPRP